LRRDASAAGAAGLLEIPSYFVPSRPSSDLVVRARSMILLKINPERIAVDKFECDAPWAVDMDRVAQGSSPQCMKVETWNIHGIGTFRAIKHVEPAQAPFMKGILDTGSIARLEQLL
jgi:hypothetical protein